MAVLLFLVAAGVIALLVNVVIQLNELEKSVLALVDRMTKNYESQ
jgi:hypothetical protein